MTKQIFVNLPVKDLNKSVAFFTKLGFTFNAQFTNEESTCMIVSENIFVMLLVEKFFKTFTKKEIADASKTTEAILALSLDSKEKVDEIVSKALAAGGKKSNDTNDQGFMYVGSFQDPDNHLWEFFWFDPKALNPA